jgi:hypothetical protein
MESIAPALHMEPDAIDMATGLRLARQRQGAREHDVRRQNDRERLLEGV